MSDFESLNSHHHAQHSSVVSNQNPIDHNVVMNNGSDHHQLSNGNRNLDPLNSSSRLSSDDNNISTSSISEKSNPSVTSSSSCADTASNISNNGDKNNTNTENSTDKESSTSTEKPIFDLDNILLKGDYTGKIFWSGIKEMATRENKRILDEISNLTVKSKILKGIEDGNIKSKIMKEGKIDPQLARQVLCYVVQTPGESKQKKKGKRKSKKELLDEKAKILLQVTECVIECNFKQNTPSTSGSMSTTNSNNSTSSLDDSENADDDLLQLTPTEKVVELEKELEAVWKKTNLLNYIHSPNQKDNHSKKHESEEDPFILDTNDKVYKLVTENSEIGFGLIMVMKSIILLSLRNRGLIDEVKKFCSDAKEEGPLVEILLEELIEEKKHRIKVDGADLSAFGENPKEDEFVRKCVEHLERIKDKPERDTEAKKFVNIMSLFMEQMEEIEKHPNFSRTVQIIRSCMSTVLPKNIGGLMAYAVKLVGLSTPSIDNIHFMTSDLNDSGQFTADDIIVNDHEQFLQMDSEYLHLVLQLLSYAAFSQQNQKETVVQANILLSKVYNFIIRPENITDRQSVLAFLRMAAWISPVTPKEETSYYYSFTTTTVLKQMDEIENEDSVLQEQRRILMEYIAQLDLHLHAYMRQIHTSLRGLFQITLKSSAGVNGYKKFVQLILSTKSYFTLEKKDEDWKLLIEYITNKYRRLRSFCRMLKDSALKTEDEAPALVSNTSHMTITNHPQPTQSVSYFPPPPQQHYTMHTDALASFEEYDDDESKKRSNPFTDSEHDRQRLKLI
nr:unnamed protein product [Naegleria fowleri]